MDQDPKGHEREIDLQYLFHAIRKFWMGVGLSIYQLILFVKQQLLFLLILLIGGATAGYFLDANQPASLRHELIVVPNYGSVDYLYKAISNQNFAEFHVEGEKIDLLSNVRKVQIEPIEDLFGFLSKSDKRIKTFSIIMDNDSDLKQLLSNPNTIRYFKYHLITIYTSGKLNTNDVVDAFLEQLNAQPYFLERQKIEKANTQLKKEEFEKSLDQVNGILTKFGTIDQVSVADRKGFEVNTYSEITDLFKVKEELLEDIKQLDVALTEQKQTIYEVDRMMNNGNSVFYKSYVFLLPAMLILLFFSIFVFVNFMKKFKKIQQDTI